jgi:thioredoxin 1
MALTDVVDGTFQAEVLQSQKPVMVDFWATWCAPCKALTPVLEDLAKTYESKLKFVKFNVEGNIETPSRYGVTGIPRLLFFKGGALVHTIAFVPKRAQLEEAIQKVIA